jgi:hypothetical protein
MKIDLITNSMNKNLFIGINETFMEKHESSLS